MLAYRWFILAIAPLVGLPVGSIYSWSVLIDSIEASRPNWSHNTIPNSLSTLLVLFGASTSYAGLLESNRLLGVVGGIIAGCGPVICFLAVRKDILPLMFVGGGVMGVGLGGSYLGLIKAVKKSWAKTNPGFAAGYIMMVSSSGSFIFVWLMSSLLNRFHDDSNLLIGPEYCFLVFGAIVAGCQVLGSLFFDCEDERQVSLSGASKSLLDESTIDESSTVSSKAQDDKLKLSTWNILSKPQFWMLLFICFANQTPMLGVLSVFASDIRKQFSQVSQHEATNYLAAINIVGTVVRLLVGLLADVVGSKLLFFFVLSVQTIAFAMLPSAVNRWFNFPLTIALMMVAKGCYGASFTLINLMCTDVFGSLGSRVYGMTIWGMVFAALIGPSLISFNGVSFFDAYCYIMCGIVGTGVFVLVNIKPVQEVKTIQSLTRVNN